MDRVWAEELPDNCPPNSAVAPTEMAVFRLIEGTSPIEDDFYSYRILWPNRSFRLDECSLHAVSLVNKLEACIALRKLPSLKNKKGAVKLTLTPDSGVVDINNKTQHISWWIRHGYAPVQHCEDITILEDHQ